MPRLTINVSEEMIKKLDRYAETMGTPRASLCTMLIGQGVLQYEQGSKIATDVMREIGNKLIEQRDQP